MSAMSVQDLRVSRGRRRVLDGVAFDLSQGEVLGLVGPNGSGKSTLLRALVGQLPAESGRVTLLGRPIALWPPRERARRLAYLPQERECHAPWRVRDLVALGRVPHGGSLGTWGPGDAEAIERALLALGIEHLANHRVTDLSGGERARALLARALCTEAPVLLADEPTDGLDPHFQLQLMRELGALAGGGAAVLVTLHDLSLASRFCDRLLLLREGAAVAIGTPQEVLSAPNLAQAYRIRAQYFCAEGVPVVVPWSEVRR
jgi:iron complex transport system ATP-binding protein